MPGNLFPKSFFIIGTDTEVGKTVVSAILVAGLSAAYWKPIQTGAEEATDTQWLRNATSLPDFYFIPEAYRLSKPLSPHAAAQIDGVRIDLDSVCLPQAHQFPHLIVEGAGGVMAPINDHQYMVDIIKWLNLPVLLVARSTLGTINHTLLSLECLVQKGIEVIGVVMNGPKNRINREAIEYYGQVRVCAEVETISEISHKSLVEAYDKYFKSMNESGKS